MPKKKASAPKIFGTPSISNNIFPGFTRALQNSTAPFPLPCLTSAGFFVTGTSGNILIKLDQIF